MNYKYFSVLNLLIGSSFKSGSVLKRLELKDDSSPRQFFVVEEFKGKSRVVNLKANIEIPTRQDQVKKSFFLLFFLVLIKLKG